MSDVPRDDFFIGWNPPSASDARWLRATSLALVVIAAAVASTLAVFQRNPGTGTWRDHEIVTVEGLALCRPYAMLRTLDPTAKERVRTVLLVSEGKFGAIDRISTVEGRYVRVRGTFLHRDDRWMLELVSDSDAVVPIEPPTTLDLSLLDPPEKMIGPRSIRGEIIDPKCYLGAMKPGSGKTHKACAALCIAGGVPPMLVTEDSAGKPEYLLLVSPENQPINTWAASLAGESIVLSGQVVQSVDLTYFKVATPPEVSATISVPTRE
jgi:hypothetical protein